MAGNLKGLTIELGGDTTKLGKALEDVNKKSRSLSSELGQVNKLLKLDPGNADLLAQKQEILAEAVANTSKKLDTLKEAERQVQEQFQRGEASEEQVRALQREIIATTQKLGQYENAARETAEALDKLGDEGEDGIKDTGKAADQAADDLDDMADAARDAGDGLDTAGVAAGTFLGNLAHDVLSSAIDFLKGCAEAAMEYRTEMGKLDVAFTNSGFSSEAATNAYRELVGVLGETDQSVEAANHLAKLTDNEKDLATWTGDILPGVFATFGDSLPIEGLTEAANETAKVGQVTGPLADAINWATAETDDWNRALSGNSKAQAAFEKATKEGASAEDAFNAALAECSTEQERQSLITQALASIYGEASSAYKETNADIIAANQANDAMTASMSAAGTAVMPLITGAKNLGASLLNAAVPALQALANNLPVVGVALAGLGAAIAAFKISSMGGLGAAVTSVTTAFKGLFATMLANPIVLIIAAITALVAGFIYLWNNCESFREFWLNLWEKIKTAALNAVEGLKALPNNIYNAIKSAVNKVKTWGENLVNTAKTKADEMRNKVVSTLKELPGKIWSAILSSVDKVKTWGTNMATAAKEKAVDMRDKVVSTLNELPGKIWSAILSAVDKVKTWGTNMATAAKEKAADMRDKVASTLKELPGKIYSAIQGAIGKVTSWGSEMVSTIRGKMSEFARTAVSTISDLPGKFTSIGRNIIQGLINGITGMVSKLYSSIKNALSGLVSKAKNALGIGSPSKVFRDQIGKWIPEGIASGIEKNIDSTIKAIQGLDEKMLDTASSELDGLQLERSLTQTVQPNLTAASIDSGLIEKLDCILTAIKAGQVLTIDGKTLVGATAGQYDATLGKRRALAARGAL